MPERFGHAYSHSTDQFYENEVNWYYIAQSMCWKCFHRNTSNDITVNTLSRNITISTLFRSPKARKPGPTIYHTPLLFTLLLHKINITGCQKWNNIKTVFPEILKGSINIFEKEEAARP